MLVGTRQRRWSADGDITASHQMGPQEWESGESVGSQGTGLGLSSLLCPYLPCFLSSGPCHGNRCHSTKQSEEDLIKGHLVLWASALG